MTILAVVGAVTLAVLAFQRAKAWWARHRAPRRVEQCSGCNRTITGRQIHTVVFRPTDDAALGIEMGATGVSVDLCRSCCPGVDAGCTRRRCP